MSVVLVSRPVPKLSPLVLPPLSIGQMTLRLYGALDYSQNSARDLCCAVNRAWAPVEEPEPRIRFPPCTIVVLALARIRNEILIFLKIKERALYDVVFPAGACCCAFYLFIRAHRTC